MTCPASALAVPYSAQDTATQTPIKSQHRPSFQPLQPPTGSGMLLLSPPVSCSLSPLLGCWYPRPSSNLIYSGQGLALSLNLKEPRKPVTSKEAISS